MGLYHLSGTLLASYVNRKEKFWISIDKGNCHLAGNTSVKVGLNSRPLPFTT